MAQQQEDIILDVKADFRDALDQVVKLRGANQALKTTAEANQKAIAELQKQVADGAKTDAEAAKEVDELSKANILLAEQVKANNKVIGDNLKVVAQQIEAEKQRAGSINELRRQAASLTAQYSALSKEERQGEVGKAMAAQLAKVNEEIRTTMVEVGNYKDNIGNYRSAIADVAVDTGSFGKALKVLGVNFGDVASGAVSGKQAIGLMANGIGGLGKAMTGLLANPFFLAVAGLAKIFMGIRDAIQRDEEQLNALNAAFAKLRPIVDLVANAFGVLATVAVDAIGGIVSAVTSLVGLMAKAVDGVASLVGAQTKLGDRYEAAVTRQEDLVKAEQALERQKRDFVVKEAQTAKELADLREAAKDKEKYTAAERLAFLDAAAAKEAELFAERKDIAQKEYELAVKEGDRQANDAATNDDLARKKAAIIQAETAEVEKRKALTAERNRYIAEERNLQAQAQKAAEARAKEVQKAIADSIAAFETLKKTLDDARAAEEQAEADMMAKADALRLENNAKIIDTQLSLLGKEREAAQAAQALTLDDEEAYLTRRTELRREKQRAEIEQEAAAYAARLAELENNDLVSLEAREAMETELTLQHEQAILAINTQYNDLIAADDRETHAELERQAAESAKKRIDTAKQISTASVQATSSMLSSIASAMDEGAKTDKRTFEVQKKVKTAQAVVDTYAAANAAYQSMAGIPIVGPALGAVAAAAAVAAGMANVKAIQSTKFEGGASSTASTASTSTASTASTSTTSTTSYYDYTQLDTNSTAAIGTNSSTAAAGSASTDPGYITRAEMVEAIAAQPAPVVNVQDITNAQVGVSVRDAAATL